MALGILTSAAVVAVAIYGIGFTGRSAPQPRGLSPGGGTVVSRAPDAGRSLLPRSFAWLTLTAPPSSWTRLTLPSGLGSLSVPPRFRAVPGDPGTATFAFVGSGGTSLGYLNVTPMEGDERLAGWAGFRLAHLRDDGTISARKDGAVESVRTGQSLRSCITDDYVTEIAHHHFQEVACLVMSTSEVGVVVATTPSGDPAHVWRELERAVAAYPLA